MELRSSGKPTKRILLVLCLLASGLCAAPAADEPRSNSDLQGAYLGQKQPGTAPEVFAPGLVSTKYPETTPVFSRNGREVYWSRLLEGGRGIIIWSRQKGGLWSPPEPLPFCQAGTETVVRDPYQPGKTQVGYRDSKPVLSCDGRRLIFTSNRPILDRPEFNKRGLNIWSAERMDRGWTEPVPLGPEVNSSGDDDVPIIDCDGTLYFLSDHGGKYASYRSRWQDGRFAVAEPFVPPVGLLTYLSPNQNYGLFQQFDKNGSPELFVSFRRQDGSFGPAIALLKEFGAFRALAPKVSADGRFLFFMSGRGGNMDIYWVSAGFLGELRKKTGSGLGDKKR